MRNPIKRERRYTQALPHDAYLLLVVQPRTEDTLLFIFTTFPYYFYLATQAHCAAQFVFLLFMTTAASMVAQNLSAFCSCQCNIGQVM